MLTIFLDSPKSSSSVAVDEEHDSMKLLVAIKINADKRLFFIFVSILFLSLECKGNHNLV